GLAAGGLIGLADDLRKLRIGSLGIPARLKLPIQALLAVPVAYGSVALSFWGMHQLFLPSSFWLLMVLAVIAIVATANAVNITDGMDGLAAGLSLIAIATVVLLLPSARSGEKAVALTLCGGLAAFLIFIRHPARVFTMTPIHYTFQHEGWSENRIALSFWGAGLVSAIAAVALVRLLV